MYFKRTITWARRILNPLPPSSILWPQNSDEKTTTSCGLPSLAHLARNYPGEQCQESVSQTPLNQEDRPVGVGHEGSGSDSSCGMKYIDSILQTRWRVSVTFPGRVPMSSQQLHDLPRTHQSDYRQSQGSFLYGTGLCMRVCFTVLIWLHGSMSGQNMVENVCTNC